MAIMMAVGTQLVRATGRFNSGPGRWSSPVGAVVCKVQRTRINKAREHHDFINESWLPFACNLTRAIGSPCSGEKEEPCII